MTARQSFSEVSIGGSLSAAYGNSGSSGTSNNRSSAQGSVGFDLLSTTEVQVRGFSSTYLVLMPSATYATPSFIAPSTDRNGQAMVSLIGPGQSLLWQPSSSASPQFPDVQTLVLGPGHYDIKVDASAMANTELSLNKVSVSSAVSFYTAVQVVPEPATSSLMLLGAGGLLMVVRRRQAVVNTATESTS